MSRFRSDSKAVVAFCILTLLSLARPLLAQRATTELRHVLRGVVFDSIAGSPLAGAIVQVAGRDSFPGVFTTTSDASGSFRIPGIPSGKFVVGFYHEALEALGLDAPLQAIELRTDTSVSVGLGIPSGSVVRALVCRDDGSTDGGGMLAGLLRDAKSHAAIAGAMVRVQWRLLTLDSGGIQTETRYVNAAIAEDGAYAACRLPGAASLDLMVTAPGYRGVNGLVVVPAGGAARHDVFLVDSTSGHGPAIIRGRVVHASGALPAAGRAAIVTLGRDVPIQDGAFELSDLPRGSWVVEVRVIGADPQSVLLNAAEGSVTEITIPISDRAQRLNAVAVVAAPDRNTQLLDEITHRQRSAFGSVFLPGHPALKTALHITDVLREARGFRYKSPTEFYARPRATGMHSRPCEEIAVYVDGAILPTGLAGLDDVAPVNEVLAIEAYPDVLFAPVRWRGNVGLDRSGSRAMFSVCAVVVVWTKHGRSP